MSEAPKEKKTPPLVPARLQRVGYTNIDREVTVEAGVTLEDVLQPEFWAHVAPSLRPYDELRVRTDDGIWYAHLLVLWVGRAAAKVIQLYHVQLSTSDVDQSSDAGYTVAYKGPHKRYCVMRDKDNTYVKDGCQTKEEAFAWREQYLKTLAR